MLPVYLFFVAVFFIAAFILVLKDRVREIIEKQYESKDIGIFALIISSIATAIAILLYGMLLYFGSKFGTSASAAPTKSDYMSAAATIIGACISLIPIIFLIQQNGQTKKQLDLQAKQLSFQQEQNNMDMFIRACGLIKKESSDSELIAGLFLFRTFLTTENGKYTAQIYDIVYETLGKLYGKIGDEHIEEALRILLEIIDFHTNTLISTPSNESRGNDLLRDLILLRWLITPIRPGMLVKDDFKLKLSTANKLKSMFVNDYISYIKKYIYNIVAIEEVYPNILQILKDCAYIPTGIEAADVKSMGAKVNIINTFRSFREWLNNWESETTLTPLQKVKISDLKDIINQAISI